MPRRSVDVLGQTFGHLIVIRRDLNRISRGTAWIVRCECGVEKSVIYSDLRRIFSCGCMTSDLIAAKRTKHGHARSRRTGTPSSPEYKIWTDILRRAHSGSTKAAEHYLHRGITVCERWLDFSNFLADMGPRPSPEHTVDRINNDGPYSPENCRWATNDVQARNKRTTVWIEANGERMCLQDWANRLGCAHSTILHRIRKLGWSPERAVTTPANSLLNRAS